MNQKQFEKYNDIASEKFERITDFNYHDRKLDTKPVGYFKDAFRRFCRNKASVVAAIIIIFLVLFSVSGPLVSKYDNSFNDLNVAYLIPKSKTFSWLGWDGYKKTEVPKTDYIEYLAIQEETGEEVVRKVYDTTTTETVIGKLTYTNTYYEASINYYTRSIMKFIQLTKEQYEALQAYQDEQQVQIIYPAVVEKSADDFSKNNANIWYKIQSKGTNRGMPVGYTSKDEAEDIVFQNDYIAYNGNDNYTSTMRIEENGEKLYNYAIKKQGGSFLVRVNYNKYFAYQNGDEEPSFLFGSDQFGRDIFVRLSSGARFSFLFAICIAAINLFIGAIYGAIEGYYAGIADLAMERVSDILSGVPFMVVVTLFKLHIMDDVGTIPTLLFAFVLTGWIGMASNTRMQFYRYKNQEYVLAARTLGASDRRIMFKHIFPNAIGTLITSSVLVIPSVIFSESSLSYLGIVNLNTSNTTSVGTMLASGRDSMATFPHIILFPAIFIALLMITFNLFGNGLRDAFNPSLRGTED